MSAGAEGPAGAGAGDERARVGRAAMGGLDMRDALMGAAQVVAAHKGAAAACSAALALALAGGLAALAGAVDVDREVVLEAPAQEQEAEPADEGGQSPEDAAWGLLGEEARARLDAYGAAERSLLAELSANVWTASRSGLTLTFSQDGRTFTENDNGRASVTAWTILAMGETQTDSDGEVRTEARAFTVQTPGGAYMATLTTRAYSDGSASVTTLRCDAFENSPSWTLAARAEGVEVEGPEQEWYESYGTTPEALSEAFDEFLGTAWPTVSKATWDGTISLDYTAGTATLPFTLDDASGTGVAATLDMSSGEFSVGRR